MKQKNFDNIIAIDPDVTKSGVAFLKPKTRHLETASLSFTELIDYLKFALDKQKDESLIVIIEASWLIKGNWHLSSWDRKQRAASKGYDVGRNHETGRKIVELCKYLGIEVFEHLPLRKIWKGAGGKITHEELASFTGIMGRTNQDCRDACLLAWHFANLPIRIKNH